MSTTQDWLANYFGDKLSILSPSVVAEGKKAAVVRISRKAGSGFSRTGYLLVYKNGTHDRSPYIVLHEGVASSEDVARMKRSLAEYES